MLFAHKAGLPSLATDRAPADGDLYSQEEGNQAAIDALGPSPAAPAAAGGQPTEQPAWAEDGIASELAVAGFVAAAREVEAEWATLTPADRAGHLGDAANAQLGAAGVPAVDTGLADLPVAGQFVGRTWRINLDSKQFGRDAVNAALMGTIASQVYHEARHAEQTFRMARLLAGRKRARPRAIAAELHILPAVAEEAAQSPLDAASEAGIEARQWYDSEYAHPEERNRILARLEVTGAALAAAQKAYHAVPDTDPEGIEAAHQALMAAQAAHDEVYAEYRALPEEVDAWEAGDAVKTGYGA